MTRSGQLLSRKVQPIPSGRIEVEHPIFDGPLGVGKNDPHQLGVRSEVGRHLLGFTC